MKVVIDIPDKLYKNLQSDLYCGPENLINPIRGGVVLPEGAEILTKEAYSDLCMRASKAGSEEP